MLENAIYSILSPEGYSSILWKDSSRYKEAAEKMKITAQDLYELKIIDKIILEKDKNFDIIANDIKNEIINELKIFDNMTKEEIQKDRYIKFRNMGEYIKK